MSSGLKIRIPARNVNSVKSASSSSIAQSNLSVEDSQSTSLMEVADVDMEESRANHFDLPEKQYTPCNNNTRLTWNKWEREFLEMCFQTTQRPTLSTRSQWALLFTEDRLQNSQSCPKDKENTVDILHTSYRKRIDNWFRNRRAKLKLQVLDLNQEDPEDDDKVSPVAGLSCSHYENIVGGFTILNEDCVSNEENDKVRIQSHARIYLT